MMMAIGAGRPVRPNVKTKVVYIWFLALIGEEG
uniref:Uncharacterized protein n=1 Tax=Rhizophora mucronata TaxID=61149 RepID=A0A2P2QS47_RHIMU